MNLSLAFIKGFGLGLEYVNLDEDDASFMGLETGNLMIILSLGFVRFTYINGYAADEE